MRTGSNITSDREELVVTLFQAAISRPDADRNNFLTHACQDPALLAEVRRRVDWEIRLAGFLLSPIVPRDRMDSPFAPGDELVNGRFRIVRRAGEGGMGIVYEAFDKKLGHRLAIKCPRFEFRRRLTPEAIKAIRITHNHVCRVFEVHTESTPTGAVDFLTMEFVDGETLAQRIEGGPIPLESRQGGALARQLCDGLDAIHAAGIVHRDLKTANVMLTRDASAKPRAVIMDFGIADGADLFTSAARGTPDYVAPEIWRGEPASRRSDIYALGVMLFEMATGRRPFSGQESWELRLKSRPPMKGVREPWRSAILKCLDPEPARRFETASAILRGMMERRWIFRAAVAAVGCAGVGLAATKVLQPSTPVRLVVLPPRWDKTAAPDDVAFYRGFVQDLSYRFKNLRRSRRSLSVFADHQSRADSVEDRPRAEQVFAATHILSAELKRSPQGFTLDAELAKAGGVSIRRWTFSGVGRMSAQAAGLLPVQSEIVRDTISSLSLNSDNPVRHQLPTAVWPDYLLGLHILRADLEKAPEALACFERVVAGAPQSALGYAAVAEALVQTMLVTRDRSLEPRAIAAFEKAQHLDPDLARVHLVSGRLNMFAGRYERAIADFRRAADLDPNDIEALGYLGFAFGYQSRFDEARAVFQAAVRAQPAYYMPHLDLGLFYYEVHDYDAAEHSWREADRLNPQNPRASINLAYIYLRDGRVKEAQSIAGVQLGSNRSKIAVELQADIFRVQRREAEAVQLLEEAVAMPPPDSRIWASVFASARALGQHEKAANAARTGLSAAQRRHFVNPRDPDANAWCAYYHALLGDQIAAANMAGQTLALASPPMGRVRRTLVFTYDELKDREAALNLIRTAPRAFARELAFGVDISTVLRNDPEFQRLTR